MARWGGMSSGTALRHVLFLLALGCLACGSKSSQNESKPEDAGVDVTPPTPARIEALSVVPNPNNSLSVFVDWRTDVPTKTDLRVDCGAAFAETFEGSAESIEHSVFVMGLLNGVDCTLTVIAESGDARATATETFAAGPLPRHFPILSLQADDGTARGWTLFNLNSDFRDIPLIVVAVDGRGRYRWYTELTPYDATIDVRTIEEGILVGGSPSSPPWLVDWQGDVAWRGSFEMHHDLRPDGDSNRLLHLSTDDTCNGGVGADTVELFDRMEDRTVWTWRICDHYTPPMIRADWAHLNTVVRFPGEDALLVSSRNQNSLFKVDRATGNIRWRMGQGGDIALDPDQVFYQQHAPEIQSNGNILLFDNGHFVLRQFSRAIEIAYDESAGTANVVWEFRPRDGTFTPIWGDADRLADGNTLVTFGERNTLRPSRIIEVGPDANEKWHLILPPTFGVYRSERIEPRVGSVLQ